MLKQRIGIACIALTLCAVIVLVTSLYRSHPAEVLPNDPPSRIAAFSVRAHNGKVAVFYMDEASPIRVYDVYVESFPLRDQALLQAGIPAQNEVELQQIIEDYTS